MLSLVKSNFSIGRTWCISWLNLCVCWSDATPDLEHSKELLWGETWLLAWNRLPEFGRLGVLTFICSASILLLNLCFWVEDLRGCLTKPMLSAKRLLGLHNHGTVSFSWKKKNNFLLPSPTFLKSLAFMWTEKDFKTLEENSLKAQSVLGSW